MSSNARKSVGGHIKRLIVRERGDVRDKMLAELDRIDAALNTAPERTDNGIR